jgi:hypothetical protein
MPVFSVFNLIPAGILFGLGKASKRTPLAFWFALAALVGFYLLAHGSMNLRSSSTAVIGFIFIPIYAVGAIVIGWVVGWVLSIIAKDDGGRFWMASIAFALAVGVSVSITLNESVSIAQREARFPVVSVKEAPLTKREVYACCSLGRVEVLQLDDFDAVPGNEIAVLGASAFAVLHPRTYAVKSKAAFQHGRCDGCVHMYPYLVPNKKDGFHVATSNGLTDSAGRLIWLNNAQGFSRVVPILDSDGVFTFFAYHNNDHVDLHSADGKILWTVNLPVENVGVYIPGGAGQFPFAITGHGKSRALHIFDGSGKPTKKVSLPEWALSVKSISWPKPGHLLVGGGSWIGVLDPEGKEVFRHVIEDTSFNPYHGPDGVAVRFDPANASYLAVVAHGSSGYARSVLLVFDPKGRLVWQEEVNKLRTVLAAPAPNGKGEVLLTGGMDGVVEYAFPPAVAPNR